MALDLKDWTAAEPAKYSLDGFSAQWFNKQAACTIINGDLVNSH